VSGRVGFLQPLRGSAGHHLAGRRGRRRGRGSPCVIGSWDTPATRANRGTASSIRPPATRPREGGRWLRGVSACSASLAASSHSKASPSPTGHRVGERRNRVDRQRWRTWPRCPAIASKPWLETASANTVFA
jgi:hypothetical protein